MKILKLLVLSLFFVAGQHAIAQKLIVNNNNTAITFTTGFDFGACGGGVVLTTPPLTTSTSPYRFPCPLLVLKLSFIDPTCNPPQPVNVAIPFTTNPTYFNYVLCDGTVVSVRIYFNGMDYIVDII